MKRYLTLILALLCVAPSFAAQRTRSVRSLVIAAANSPKEEKYGGTIQLLDGCKEPRCWEETPGAWHGFSQYLAAVINRKTITII